MNSEALSGGDSAWAKIAKAIAVGIVAGIAATAVKILCEAISAPRPPGVNSPLLNGLDIMSVKMTGSQLLETVKPMAEKTAHWFFGVSAGCVYAVLAEKFSAIRAGRGVLFGVAFWLGLHEVALPLMGWSPTPAKMTQWEQGNELFSHCFYGLTLELVRRGLRKKLD
ncbi:MAG: hypothetical protein DLM52_04095 [Chthoniobacterales bacterium]|nr:MAG: hypothetical protein DLM52_04095 [Chthoniobacterales bacterium]